MISLDQKPDLWEDRATLFVGYLIEKGVQSSTVKSYVSAIKRILVDDGYEWKDEKILLSSLTRACRIVNNKVFLRLPIQCSLLELILFEVERQFTVKSNQPFLKIMYQTMFGIAYYGLMRVSEITLSPHVVKAKDVHIAENKDKILIVLRSSKMHGKGSRPQKIKVTSNDTEKSGKYKERLFCPFKLVRQYVAMRGTYDTAQEQFFVFRDRSPVTAEAARKVLRTAIGSLGLESSNYGMHFFRIGRTTDMIKYNFSISEVKLVGRWRSSVIYRYIR